MSSTRHAEQKIDESQDLESQSVVYLRNILPETLESIAKKYPAPGKERHITVQELDQSVARYWLRSRIYQAKHLMACGSWFVGMVFQAQKGRDGIIGLGNTLGLEIPDTVALSIASVVTAYGTFCLVFFYSPREKSIEEVAKYIFGPSLKERFENGCRAIKTKPMDSFVWVIAEASSFITNNTGAMLPALGFEAPLKELSIAKRLTAIVPLVYVQDVYLDVFFDLRRGFEFFKSDDPGVLRLFWNWQFATALQILFQGLSAIGLRAYPFYYFMAKACENLIGVWFPVPLVVTASIIQSFLTLYVITCKRYTQDQLDIDKLILKKLDRELTESIHAFRRSLGLTEPLSENDLKKAKLALAQAIKKFEQEKFVSDQKNGFVLRSEPYLGFTIPYRSFIGGVLGYQVSNLIFVSPFATIGCAIGSAFILGELLRRAEYYRVTHKLLKKKYKAEEAKQAVNEEKSMIPKKNCSSCLIKVSPSAVVAGGMMNFVLMMGTLETKSQIVSSSVALIALERMINSILYNQGIQKTLQKLFYRGQARVTAVSAAFFGPGDQKAPAVEPERRSSWKCWQRKK